jgi:hypothetical protein
MSKLNNIITFLGCDIYTINKRRRMYSLSPSGLMEVSTSTPNLLHPVYNKFIPKTAIAVHLTRVTTPESYPDADSLIKNLSVYFVEIVFLLFGEALTSSPAFFLKII